MEQFLRITTLSGIAGLLGLPSLWAQVFINEIHYDNAGADEGEAVEVAGPAGTNLTGWQLSFYNGSNGASYDTQDLSGTLTDQTGGFGLLTVFLPGIQNGAPDGVALVDATGVVVEFLSYEGDLTATDGPAAGLRSTNIGVSETSTTAAGFSLQRTGSGTRASDFRWRAPAANTWGAINAGQTFGDGEVAEETLDVVTWNIEWFGSTGNGPSPEETQRDNARAVIETLDADLYAFQEISDDALLAQIAEALPDYELLVQTDFVSQPPNTPGVSQKLAFLYRSSVVRPVRTEGLLADVHPLYNGGDDGALSDYPVNNTTRFYSSGRLPYLLEADVTLNGITERINFINLHARANGSSNPEERYAMRRYDVEVLKEYIDTELTNAAVILLGDYNDDVDETVADISSTTSSYVAYTEDDRATSTDAQFYRVVTEPLSAAGLRSYVFRDNMIDHISVTDELINRVLVGSATVHSEFLDDNYASTTSDHLPVSARFVLSEPTTTTPPLTTDVPTERPTVALSVYPVPVRDVLTVRVVTDQPDRVTLRLIDGYGRLVHTQYTSVRTGEQRFTLDINTRRLPRGIYLLTGQGNDYSFDSRFGWWWSSREPVDDTWLTIDDRHVILSGNVQEAKRGVIGGRRTCISILQ